MSDDYRSKQSTHAQQIKAERALVDSLGVTRSQARAALHQAEANQRFNQIRPGIENLVPRVKELPKIENAAPAIILPPPPVPAQPKAENPIVANLDVVDLGYELFVCDKRAEPPVPKIITVRVISVVDVP